MLAMPSLHDGLLAHSSLNTTVIDAGNQRDELGLSTRWQRFYRRYDPGGGIWRPSGLRSDSRR